MKKLIFCHFLLLICLLNSQVLGLGQEKNNGPGVSTKSEATILYTQGVLDSLVKIKLEEDLVSAGNDREKVRELESKLKKIALDDSLRKLELLTILGKLSKNTQGYPVCPFEDTLFLIYAKIGSLTARERASAISKRIEKLYFDPYFNPDSLKVLKTDLGTEILYGEEVPVMMVTMIDALVLKRNDLQLANEYIAKIRAGILHEREVNRLSRWLGRIGMAAMTLAGLILLIYLIVWLFRWVKNFLFNRRERFLNGLTIGKTRILTPQHFETMVLRAVNISRFILIVLAVYLSLPVLFSNFPETRLWTSTLVEWILSPARAVFRGLVGFLPNLFTILVIVIVFRYAIKGVRFFVNQVEKGEIVIKGFYADWADPTFRILKFILYAFMFVLIFPYLPGSGSPAFQGISVFLGLLISLGSSSAISNMVAGLVITYMRPFKVGDRVKIGDVTGDVLEKTMLVTRIRTIKNEDITVPNSTVLSSSTTNFSANAADKGLIIYTSVTIGYDVPWKEMHKALINAAMRTERIMKEPGPFVLQTSLDDFYVNYQLNAYTRFANEQMSIYSELHQHIQDCCNEVGIEILSPHYRYLRDGNKTSIPENYLDKDYEAPPFKVRNVKD